MGGYPPHQHQVWYRGIPRMEGYKLTFDVFRPICLHIGGLGKLTKQVKVYIVDVTRVNIWLGSYTLGVVLRLVVPLV